MQVYQIFGHLSVLCRCRHSKSSWIRFLIHWSILFEIILKSSNRTFAAVFCWILFTNTMPFYLDKVILDNSFVFAWCNHSFLKKKSQKKISDHQLNRVSSVQRYVFSNMETLRRNLLPQKKEWRREDWLKNAIIGKSKAKKIIHYDFDVSFTQNRNEEYSLNFHIQMYGETIFSKLR